MKSLLTLDFYFEGLTMSLNTRAKFLMIVSITFFIYSILWALAPYPEVNLPARFIVDIADWPVDSLSSPLDRNTEWLSAQVS